MPRSVLGHAYRGWGCCSFPRVWWAAQKQTGEGKAYNLPSKRRDVRYLVVPPITIAFK